jgi:hypothetical protein
MHSIEEVLNKKLYGLHYENLIILPFSAHFFKVVVSADIITDFSPSSKVIYFRETDDFTGIYFLKYKDLKDATSKYEAIKVVLVEKGKDIFDFNNHIKLSLYLESEHKVKIEKCDQDIIFLE